MNENVDALGRLLSDPLFYENHRDLERHEDIIAAIQKEIPTASAEEIDGFLTQISSALQREEGELSEEALEDVAGGIVITTTVIGTVCACVTLASAVGGLVGGAIWYWKNRKK